MGAVMSCFLSQFLADFQSFPTQTQGGTDAGMRMLLDRAALSALSDAQNPYAPLVLTNNRGYVSRHRSGQPHTAATVEEFDDRTEREVRRFEEWRRQHEVLRLIDSCQLTERYLCVTQQARSDSEQYQKYEEEADTPDSPQYEEEADTSDSPQDMEDADTPDWPQRGRRAYYARFIDSRVGSHKVLPPARRCFGKTTTTARSLAATSTSRTSTPTDIAVGSRAECCCC
jgi:hypothetical protein